MPVVSSVELEIHSLRPEDRDDLAQLFAAFVADPQTVHFFHPHPFTRERLESDIGPRLVNMVRNVEVALSGR